MHFFVQRSELRDLYNQVAGGERLLFSVAADKMQP